MGSAYLTRKLFLMYGAIIVATVGVLVAAIASAQQNWVLDEALQRLRDAAWFVRGDLGEMEHTNEAALQAVLHEHSAQTDIRFTVVDAEGNVLADSEQELLSALDNMENHLTRKEFVQALREGAGHAKRRSPTWGASFLYYVEVIEQGGQLQGFIRTALPTGPIVDRVAARQRYTMIGGAVAGALALVVTFGVASWCAQPLARLTDATAEIAAGNYSRRIPLESVGELGPLAQAIERIRTDLGSREAQLRESVQRHSTVLGGMGEGVIAVDTDQRVLFANVSAGKNLGFNPDHVEGVPLLEVVRSHDLREIVAKSLEISEPVRGEIAWHSRTQMLTLDVHATPLAGTPPAGVVLVLRDLTELKRLEGLRHQFVANVSHELKTPLSSIKAYTETLLNGAIDDTQYARHFLTRIDEQASRLHELILDLLTIARIESGQAALEIAPLALSGVVASCLRNYEERAKAGDISLDDQTRDSQLVVMADEESLGQILNNLVDNAIKYTPAGGTITVRCRAEENQAVIEVADTGVGIEPEHHGRLFERFYRVDKARSRELGGTGLGLSIVKHLCQAMQGSVAVESSLGQGTVFRVRLPLVERP